MGKVMTPVDLKDTPICKDVILTSISVYCMQLIYTGDIGDLPKSKSILILLSLIDQTQYDESIKRWARNLVCNTFKGYDIGETILQSQENIDFITNTETINKLEQLLKDIGYYNLKETIRLGLEKNRIDTKRPKDKELGAARHKNESLVSIKYKNINGNKLRVDELREIYNKATMKHKGIKPDYYIINSGTAYKPNSEGFGERKHKITDFLEALYTISTGKEMPDNYENRKDIHKGIKYRSKAIEIVEYKLRLIDRLQCEFITADIMNDVLEIERLFNFN